MANPQKKFFILFFILLALFLAGWLLPNEILTRLTTEIVHQQINSDSSQYYRIEYDDMHTNLMAGSVSIINLRISPKNQDNDFQSALYKLDIPLFKITGFETIDFIRSKTASVSTIEIRDPQVEVISNQQKDAPAKAHQLLIRELFTEHFTELSIENLDIVNGSFSWASSMDESDTIMIIESFNLHIADAFISGETLKTSKPIHLSDFVVSTDRVNTKHMANHHLYWGSMEYTLSDSLLTINDFSFKNKLGFVAFNESQNHSLDWYNISVPAIQLAGFHPDNLLQDSSLRMESLKVFEPKIEIKRDKNLADNPNKYAALPAEMLQRIPKNFVIDTTFILDGKLYYHELPEGKDESGVIFFTDIFTSSYFIGNYTPFQKESTAITVDFSARLLDKVDFTAHLLFDRDHQTNGFSCYGEMDAVSASVFNSVVEPLAQISIKSGEIEKMIFDFKSRNNRAHGSLIFDYSDLQITMLDEDNDRKMRLKNFIANRLIRSNNLPDRKNYAIGVINCQRNTNKSIANFLWSSVKAGLTDIAVPMAQ